MKKLLLAGLASLALLGVGSANAADMAVPRYKAGPAPIAAPAYNWSGFYIGANIGGGIANGDMIEMDCYSCASPGAFHRGFVEIGGQLGYNWQLGPLVVGLEGDINWVSAKASGFYAQDDGCCHGPTQFKFDAFASIRGRAGLAVGPALLYVTAGPAWGHFDSFALSVGNDPFIVTDRGWRFGLAAGAGAEYMFAPRWIVRGEFLFLDFVDKIGDCAQTGRQSGTPACTVIYETTDSRINFANSALLARVALNYQFDFWGKAPVVARY